MGDGHESLEVNTREVPDDERVDQVVQEAADLTHDQAGHGLAGEDGGGGEEEEGEAEERVGEAEVDQQQASGLPGLREDKVLTADLTVDIKAMLLISKTFSFNHEFITKWPN